MLASLSSRLLDVRVEYQRGAEEEEDSTILVDVDALHALSLPDVLIPGVSGALPSVATRFAGLCTRIYGALGDDIHTLSQALLALEDAEDEEADMDEPSMSKSRRSLHLPHRRQRRRISLRPRPTHLHDTLLLPSPRPCVPSIVLSPAPPSPFTTASRTPWQDAAFGSRLPVSGHPAFNAAHPPLLARPLPGRPDAWEWRAREGRWVALLPGLDAQAARGLYSRPVSVKRKAARRRRDGQAEVETR
ncbi:hypothetical protein K525DRAFT_215734 [Schizophyllum commune Loenen D]|nr:hypothetical protein K525DRAFT_215734 [Schizophyllum commune Loenen D]